MNKDDSYKLPVVGEKEERATDPAAKADLFAPMSGNPMDDVFDIVIYPDEVLRKKCEEVTNFDDELKDFTKKLMNTMYVKQGAGLAAPQVGKAIRVISVDVSNERNQGIIMVNPVIASMEGKQKMREACLSLPHPKVFGFVTRPEKIVVEYDDVNGAKSSMKAEGMQAQALQHEIDHLDGIMFIDKLGPTKRSMIQRHIKVIK
jgi:peptide deformylase